MSEVAKTLGQRNTTHGDFKDNARAAQELRYMFRDSPGWHRLKDEHKEALDQIACKISRILSGNADFADHWHDIGGYAALAEKACVVS